MIYQAYQAYTDVMYPIHGIANSVIATCNRAREAVGDSISVRRVAAANALLALARLTHKRPDFGIKTVAVGGKEVPVSETVVHRTPFCSLLHFSKAGR